MAEKKVVDWEGVEIAYRAGVDTIREIGAKFGISHGLVNRRARSHGWEQDIAEKVRAKADALVSKAAVSNPVSEKRVGAVIDSNAQQQADTRLSHRADVRRFRSLSIAMLGELEHQSMNPELYERLADLLNESPDDDATEAQIEAQRKRMEAFGKALSLGSRIKTMKEATETFKTLVALEREAMGIDDRKAAPVATTFNLSM